MAWKMKGGGGGREVGPSKPTGGLPDGSGTIPVPRAVRLGQLSP